MPEIACFISPHGLGHATRTIAILEGLQHIRPDIHPRVLTAAPETLFAETLDNFSYLHRRTDLGLVQTSALSVDLPATLNHLDASLPYPPSLVENLAKQCVGCALILCDIAPLGILVARMMGIPAVLVENFTWDWIYLAYANHAPQIVRHAHYLRGLFAAADYRIQTAPLCRPAPRNLICGPIFRRCRGGRKAIRQAIGNGRSYLVCITMGGISEAPPPLTALVGQPEIGFVVTGRQYPTRPADNVLYLDRQTTIYHPDLVNAVDLVVGKAGYSTIAECRQAGVPMIVVDRGDFPESAPLVAYLREQEAGISVSPEDYRRGSWLNLIPALRRRPALTPAARNGADQAAAFLAALLAIPPRTDLAQGPASKAKREPSG